MSTPERPECVALMEYMAEEGHLFEKIRMNFEWDEPELQKLVRVSTRCLEEIEHDALIPRHVAGFFGYWLPIIMGMMQHPGFLSVNREGRSEQETKAYFDRRIELMKKLVRWMSNGPRPYPAADYVLPGWPPIAETFDVTAPSLIPRTAPAPVPDRPACAALHAFMRAGGRRFEQPSASLEWDDDAFRTLVQLTTKCLKEIEHDALIPRHVASLIGDRLQDLMRTTLRDPQFLALNRGDRTEQQNEAYFNERVSIVGHLATWVSAGECQHLPVHFVAPEWRTSAEREEADRIKTTKWWVRDKVRQS